MASALDVFDAARCVTGAAAHMESLEGFLRCWDGSAALLNNQRDPEAFQSFLADAGASGRDEIIRELCRVHVLCSDAGRELLAAACSAHDWQPDPTGQLPVECVALKTYVACPSAFTLAHDLAGERRVHCFKLFLGKTPRQAEGSAANLRSFQRSLSEHFREKRQSGRVRIRPHGSAAHFNILVSYEDWPKARLVFKGQRRNPRKAPITFRAVHDVVLMYEPKRAILAVEAGRAHDEAAMRHCFGAAFLGDEHFFEGRSAEEVFDLRPIASDEFTMECFGKVDRATLTNLVMVPFRSNRPRIRIDAEDALAEANALGVSLRGCELVQARFCFNIRGDRNDCSVQIAGRNIICLDNMDFAETIHAHLRQWGIAKA